MKYIIGLLILATLTAGFKLSEQDSLSILAGKATGDWGGIHFANNASSVSAGNFTAVVGSLTTAAQRIQILNTASSVLYFAVGAQSSETSKFLVYPGDNDVNIDLPVGTRVAVKAYSTGETINVGRMFINFFGQN